MEVRLLSSHRGWDSEILSSGVDWNSRFFFFFFFATLSFLKQELAEGHPRMWPGAAFHSSLCRSGVEASVEKGLRRALPESDEGKHPLLERTSF